MSTTTATSTTRTTTTTTSGTTTASTTGSLHADGRLLLPADYPTLLYPDQELRTRPSLAQCPDWSRKCWKVWEWQEDGHWSLTIGQAKESARIWISAHIFGHHCPPVPDWWPDDDNITSCWNIFLRILWSRPCAHLFNRYIKLQQLLSGTPAKEKGWRFK